MNDIRIRISNLMTNNIGIYGNENGFVRIPNRLLQILGFALDQQITLTSITGNPVILTVRSAFKDDVEQNDLVCYVTEQTFSSVNVENTDKHKVHVIKKITLGCDPEFFLLEKDSRKVLRANAFFNKTGEVGHDGILAELRPSPSISSSELTFNLFKLILKTRSMLNQSTVYDPSKIIMHAASSYVTGFPSVDSFATAGFHLHFGLPNGILGKDPKITSLMFQMVKVMDYYVGLVATMLEPENDTLRRSNTGVSYGKPSDFRSDFRTFEYRVPGGSLLRHPLLSMGLIALGSVVMEDLTKKINSYTEGFKQLFWVQGNTLKELYRNVPTTSSIFSLICSPDTRLMKTHLDVIQEDVSKMDKTREAENNINTLFEIARTGLQYTNNIEENWRTFYDRQEVNICQQCK